MASNITGPKGELKEFKFKPGVGMIYVDERGNRFVRTRYVRRGVSREENQRDYGNGRPHMSKKARLKLKRQYEQYRKEQTNEES